MEPARPISSTNLIAARDLRKIQPAIDGLRFSHSQAFVKPSPNFFFIFAIIPRATIGAYILAERGKITNEVHAPTCARSSTIITGLHILRENGGGTEPPRDCKLPPIAISLEFLCARTCTHHARQSGFRIVNLKAGSSPARSLRAPAGSIMHTYIHTYIHIYMNTYTYVYHTDIYISPESRASPPEAFCAPCAAR